MYTIENQVYKCNVDKTLRLDFAQSRFDHSNLQSFLIHTSPIKDLQKGFLLEFQG
jgi:hypothetical protein